MSFETMLLIFALAFLFEMIDSSLGQGYGTLGAPCFILLGFDPKLVVPAILVSQAMGGLSSAVFHHRFHNADFGNLRTEDVQKVVWIAGCGIGGVIAASAIGVKVPKTVLSLYIGILVTTIGILLLSGLTWQFTWRRLIVIGLLSAFNKGLSGGGYGPLVAGGQSLIGVGGKAAVAVTDLAEVPICITGFCVWTLLGSPFDLKLALPMCLGAMLAPLPGTWITYKLPAKNFRHILGGVLLILGSLSIFKILNP